MDAIRHIYNSTSERVNEEPARKLITQFAAHNFLEFKTREFDILLSEGGVLVVDLCAKLRQKLRGEQLLQDDYRGCIIKAEEVLAEVESNGNSRAREATAKVRVALFTGGK